jgi:hypothetical protein
MTSAAHWDGIIKQPAYLWHYQQPAYLWHYQAVGSGINYQSVS